MHLYLNKQKFIDLNLIHDESRCPSSSKIFHVSPNLPESYDSGLATIVLGWPQQNYMQVKNHICTLIDI